MPDGTPGVDGGVVLLSAEDDLAATVRPRLEAASAHLDRVEMLRGVTLYDHDTEQSSNGSCSCQGISPIGTRHLAGGGAAGGD